MTYDANGNLINDGVRQYGWDARNRLAGIGGPVPASFQYDALGRRVSRRVPGGTIDYLYDGIEHVQEIAGGASVARGIHESGLLRRSREGCRRCQGCRGALHRIAPADESRRHVNEPWGTAGSRCVRCNLGRVEVGASN